VETTQKKGAGDLMGVICGLGALLSSLFAWAGSTIEQKMETGQRIKEISTSRSVEMRSVKGNKIALIASCITCFCLS